MKKIISICGPTASGKSSLALAMCREFDGELVSCDSMQIYKYLDIGTAKPTAAEMTLIPHHMVDFLDPRDSFSAAEYAKLAQTHINGILSRGKLPIICGGTGLYLDALMNKTEYVQTVADESLRKNLMQRDKHELWCELASVDPDSASSIHENNVKRVVRALEIYYITGKTKTHIDAIQRKNTEANDDWFNIILDFADRDRLYNRINERCDLMVESGLIEEIRSLLDKGLLKEGTTAYQAIGYKEVIGYISGIQTLDKAMDDLKQATRNYAKRQITWFKRVPGQRIYVDEYDNAEQMAERVSQMIREALT